MLDNNQIAAASRTLRDHWRAGAKIDALDPSQRPRNRAEGYAIQAAIESYSTTDLFGWKIAATSEAGQKHINVDGPMAGRILSETVIADGGTASMAGNEMRVAEPEFAFRMATDLPSARFIRPSRFRIRDLRILSAPARRKSSPTMPVRIYSCSAPPQQRTGARATLSGKSRSSRCAESNSSVMEKMCWATPALRWRGSPTN
jgi:hypothetical protein